MAKRPPALATDEFFAQLQSSIADLEARFESHEHPHKHADLERRLTALEEAVRRLPAQPSTAAHSPPPNAAVAELQKQLNHHETRFDFRQFQFDKLKTLVDRQNKRIAYLESKLFPPR